METKKAEPCEDKKAHGIDGPVDWIQLEANAEKMFESSLELANRA